MRKSLVVMVLLGVLAAACAGSSNPATAPSSASATGTWSGTLADSTTPGLGTGGMMGQAGMGTMTLRLVQDGSNVTGTMAFAGTGNGMMQGTMTGTMSDEDMTFTMNMPASSMGSMMAGGCSAQATGTAHMNGAAMTMTGNYSGTNSCSGAFNNGQISISRR